MPIPHRFSRSALLSLSVAVLLFASACAFMAQTIPALMATPTESAPGFGEVVFCSEVTPQGQPVNPSAVFPAGVNQVWALIPYHGLTPGQEWGRVWKHSGEVYMDARGESWEGGQDGWVAYALTSGGGGAPLAGEYQLELYLGDRLARSASFSIVAPPQTAAAAEPSFINIVFSSGVTADRLPLGVAREFTEGIPEIFAVYSFRGLAAGQPWAREWVKDGVTLVRKELTWDGPAEGVNYAAFSQENGPLSPGEYTFNLYLGQALARSASFHVLSAGSAPTPQPTAPPAQWIDADILPAWEKLNQSSQPLVRELALLPLEDEFRVLLDDNTDGIGAYQYTCQSYPGVVRLSRAYWESISLEEQAGVLAHELMHAQQHRSGLYPCSCTVEKEYQAFTVQLATLVELNRQDLVVSRYRFAFGDDGKYDPDLLWSRIRQDYQCPLN